jgi:hypothetical protein
VVGFTSNADRLTRTQWCDRFQESQRPVDSADTIFIIRSTLYTSQTTAQKQNSVEQLKFLNCRKLSSVAARGGLDLNIRINYATRA